VIRGRAARALQVLGIVLLVLLGSTGGGILATSLSTVAGPGYFPPSGGGGAPSGAAGGDLAGTYPDPTIGANAIGSTEITAGSVALSDFADLAEARAIGRAESAGTGAPVALTGTQLAEIIPDATPTTAGVTKTWASECLAWQSPATGGASYTVPTNTVEWLNTAHSRCQVDTTNLHEVRILGTEAAGAPTTGDAGVQCSADQSTWFFVDGTADGDLGSEAPQVALAANTRLRSAWQVINPAGTCIGDTYWRVVTDDGTGAGGPNFSSWRLQFRRSP
jgi:hypothetical protein